MGNLVFLFTIYFSQISCHLIIIQNVSTNPLSFTSQIQINSFLHNYHIYLGYPYFSYFRLHGQTKLCKKICQKPCDFRKLNLAMVFAALSEKEYCYFQMTLEINEWQIQSYYKNMQNQIQVKNSFCWKPASKFIQFAFEEGGLRPLGREEEQEQNLENGSPRKISKPQEQEQEQQENSYQPSNEVIDFQKLGRNNESIQIQVTGHQVVDEVSHTCVFVTKAFIPTLLVSLADSSKTEAEQQGIPEKSKYIELFLAQKSHSCEYEKYKIIKGAIRGSTREKIRTECIKLEKIKFNYLSNPQKLPRLILAFYQQNQKGRIYKNIMASDEFVVVDSHKALFIESNDQLRLYFEPIQTHFLDKSGTVVGKVATLNKHKIIEEMSALENYFIKKNKKIWNIVYAAYKYSHIIDLYFLNSQTKSKKDQFLDLWKQVIESFRAGQIAEGERTCNHLDSSARFVLKVNAQLRYVRFLVNKQVTKYLSIIATDAEFDTCGGKWTKFDTINDMKEAYILCQAEIQAKIISDPIIVKTTVNLTSSIQHPTSAPIDSQKKPSGHHSKNDDDDFNEEDVEDEDDDLQYEGESSQNYSVSNRKRGRKLGQKKIQDVKKQNTISYRGGNRTTRNREETQDSNDKRANIAKKNKEKQATYNRAPMTAPLVGTPPFRVLTPAQAGQYKDQQTQSMEGKMMGIIPYPMLGKKPDEQKPQVPGGVPKGLIMLPPGTNPQMMMMPGGVPGGMMTVMPMGNGMQAVMMPGQMDKNGQGQGGMAGMGAMGAMGMSGMGGIPGMTGMTAIPGMPGMAGMTGMSGMAGMAGMNGMMPFMMGGSGMPQGFMMPMMAQQSQGQSGDKNKQAQLDKQKQGEKKQQKKDHFPPQMSDYSKMGIMGQMPGGMGMMPVGQMAGMQMPQFMQMGMPPGMSGMGMMGGGGMPQGIMMNPMMAAMSKPSTESKEEGGSKQQNPTSMPNPMMGGGMPFMMAQVPPQMQGGDSNTQTPSGMQMSMMGQFPTMVQMPQQPQMGSGSSQSGGMPIGYTMMVSPEQSRQMTPAQLQQMQMQLQMMMSKGVMPSIMQIQKDPNDQSKK